MIVNMPHLRIIACCALLILTIGVMPPALGRDVRDDITVSAYAAPSQILNVLDIYENLLETSRYVGFGAQVGFRPRPENGDWFEKAFNYPEFGLGLWYQPLASSLQFKGDSHLGNMLNVYGSGNWNFLKNTRVSFGPAVKLGISIAGSKYSSLTNQQNLYIGTNLEYFVAVGFEGAVKLADRFALTFAVMGLHHSNGKQGVPNYGLNEVCLSAGPKYYISRASVHKDTPTTPVKPEVRDFLTLSPYLGTGFHSCERIWTATGRQGAAPMYQRLMAGVDLAVRYHPVFSSGIGLDMIYTPNIADVKACDKAQYPEEYGGLSYCPVYFGLSLLQQFWYKRFEIHVKIGYYLFKHLGITEDWGKTYQKIGFRYSFRNNLYLGFDMLAVRFDSSDCLEFSIGYDIPLVRNSRIPAL